GAALGAVTVDDVRFAFFRARVDVMKRGNIGKSGVTAHLRTRNTELQKRLELSELFLRILAAGGFVGDHAYQMAAPRLRAGKIAYMAEKAADRGAQNVENTQRTLGVHSLRTNALRS